MDFTGFTDLETILTFPGMIIAVMLLVQFTKRMFDALIPFSQTKWVVLGWSIVLCALAAWTLGDWTNPISTVVLWFINSIIIWFTSMKAFETATGNTYTI